MALSIYKPGQGKYARVSAGILLGLLTGYGVRSLKQAIAHKGQMFEFGGQSFTYGQVIPVLVFIGVAAGILWFLNYPKIADFLIETETEMSRVIWPTRKAIIGSSVVVVVAVVVMSIFLYGVDRGLLWVLELAGLY